MRITWRYWRLMDKSGRVIGFMRDGRGIEQFAELYGRRWHGRRIPYADRVRVVEIIGLRACR
jgi:hypothetical protein